MITKRLVEAESIRHILRIDRSRRRGSLWARYPRGLVLWFHWAPSRSVQAFAVTDNIAVGDLVVIGLALVPALVARRWRVFRLVPTLDLEFGRRF